MKKDQLCAEVINNDSKSSSIPHGTGNIPGGYPSGNLSNNISYVPPSTAGACSFLPYGFQLLVVPPVQNVHLPLPPLSILPPQLGLLLPVLFQLALLFRFGIFHCNFVCS